jgi:sorbitol/mannitol transport system permease protein
MSMRASPLSRAAVTVLAWTLAIAMFFPVLWAVLTSFKTETDAIGDRGLLAFQPTMDSYAEVFARADYLDFAQNSLIVSVGATLLAVVLGVPAAYSMTFHPTRRTRAVLLWMLSTRMLPAVGVLMPIYVIFRVCGLLDTRTGLILIDALMVLPLIVWMLVTYFREIPRDILEAARMDGARITDEIRHLLLPLAAPGIASTSLLSLILCWNEAFWSLSLTSAAAAPLPAFIASFSSPEGLFFAKLSAASTLAIAPILVFGMLGQRQMVRGLTFGAVK